MALHDHSHTRGGAHFERTMSASEKTKSEPARRVQFAFTDEQEQFRSALRRFLNDKSPTTEVRRLMATAEGYNPDVWRQLSEELALPGIQIPEQYGGAGFGMVELCIVTEEQGRALLCAPYFSTTVLAANGDIERRHRSAESEPAARARERRAACHAGRHRARRQLGSAFDRSSPPRRPPTAIFSREPRATSWTAMWPTC